jgi:sulfonate transport system ATP-binding protein
MERLWHDRGFTALFVTHNVAEAVTLVDGVLMVEDDEISLDLSVEVPPPRRRRFHPKSSFP